MRGLLLGAVLVHGAFAGPTRLGAREEPAALDAAAGLDPVPEVLIAGTELVPETENVIENALPILKSNDDSDKITIEVPPVLSSDHGKHETSHGHVSDAHDEDLEEIMDIFEKIQKLEKSDSSLTGHDGKVDIQYSSSDNAIKVGHGDHARIMYGEHNEDILDKLTRGVEAEKSHGKDGEPALDDNRTHKDHDGQAAEKSSGHENSSHDSAERNGKLLVPITSIFSNNV